MTSYLAGAPLDSVHRALLLVKSLEEGNVLSVTGAAEFLDVAPSTAHRLLAALCFDGFALQDSNKQYRAGPAIQRQRVRGLPVQELAKAIRPSLLELNEVIDETVQLWVLRGRLVRYVDGVESMKPLSVRTGMWDNVPASDSAAGRAMLAELNEAEVDRLHAGGVTQWGKSRIHTLVELEAHLETVRRDGYATSVEEAVAGVNGVAGCIRGINGEPVAALSIAIPTVRFSAEFVRECADTLRRVTRVAERALADLTRRLEGAPSR
ncbi:MULTISPECIES: IclR family transcriptional regulator [unclassified Diaminobutyricimonas]|uniref:IclR family transcriptional regulator n=1 Tax=unclassified Diaminobutyricimonas TaxID=2643261 RepID=UPI0012F4D6ED|nr:MULTISPECIES: IclR family transcriptional regulator [unclassified Diaminobutyricimonas]